jgi:hypothetical protein
MIIKENITIDGREFTRTYSDTYKIRKIGTDEIYTDTMDVSDYQYEETDIPLEVPEADAQDIIKILTGEMP